MGAPADFFPNGAIAVDEENQYNIREAVYKTILSVDEMAEGDNPTQIREQTQKATRPAYARRYTGKGADPPLRTQWR